MGQEVAARKVFKDKVYKPGSSFHYKEITRAQKFEPVIGTQLHSEVPHRKRKTRKLQTSSREISRAGAEWVRAPTEM